MYDLRSRISSLKEFDPAGLLELSGWKGVLVYAWLFFALIGAADLALSAAGGSFSAALSGAPRNTLAVGPGFAQVPYTDISGLSGTTTAESIIPVKLDIPSIGVSASVEQVGVDHNGAMQTPSSFRTVGWYKDGAKPGEAGNAVIDGHVNNALTTAGVFEHLGELRLGDTIRVADASGRTLTFVVNNEQVYSVDNAPTAGIFSRTGAPGLALITCDGAWDNGKKEFNKRLVVYAALVPAQ